MSNLTNERIKESILDKIGSMSVNQFMNELESKSLKEEAADTDIAVQKLYDIMWEEYPDE